MTLIEKIEEKIEKVYQIGRIGKYLSGYIDGLKLAIKLAENHSDWTPASQPPKEDGEYYVQASLDINFIADYDIEHNEWVVEGHEIDIDAWQPLPKAYRGETK